MTGWIGIGAANAATSSGVSVAIAPSNAIVSASLGKLAFTATVLNGTTSAVTWKVNGVTGGNATIGTISTAGVYIAPAAPPSPATVTVSAVSSADSTRSASAAVAIAADGLVRVSPGGANVEVGVGTRRFAAIVTNESNTSVSWQVNGVPGGNSAVGTISTLGVYAAPATIPSNPIVTLTAVLTADATKHASASVTIEPHPAVTLSPTGAIVPAVSGAQTFVATVSNLSDASLTWNVNGVVGGNAIVGTISAGTYKAPAAVPSPSTVTVTAVSVADPTRSASARVQVTAPVSVAVTVSPTLASVSAGSGKQQLTARVTNGATGSVTWKINGVVGGNSTVGTVSSGGLYAAPAKVPSPATVSVTAVSVDDPTKSATASITVVAVATPPTISGSPPTSATTGKAYSFTPSATGAAGVTLTFAVANLPAWATFSTSTGHLAGTPSAASVGTDANISISVSDGTNTAILPAFTITVVAGSTGSASLSWSIPTQRTDGTALGNLAGFHIHYGTTPGTYPTTITIANPTISTYVVSNLVSGTYYFVATAFDSSGLESAYTAPASDTIP